MRFNRVIVTNDLTNRSFYMSDIALKRLADSYNERNYPVFYGHNSGDIRQYVAYSISGTAKLVDVNGVKGISIEFETLDTEEGKLFEKLLSDENTPMGFSVGIQVHDYDFDESSGLIVLKDVSAIEFSATPVPTDINTFSIESDDALVSSFAKWDTAYINSLPNSAFAVVEKDYLEGRIKDKRARHLPYKDKEGKIDLPHLRNALARMNQIKPVGESETAEELRERARKVLIPLAKKYLPNSKWAKEEMAMEEKKLENEVVVSSNEDAKLNEAIAEAEKENEFKEDFRKELASIKEELHKELGALREELNSLKEEREKAFTKVKASAPEKNKWAEFFGI